MNNPYAADQPGVYTAEEAALILRCTADWLKRRAAARLIPFTMLGGSYRFSNEHLKEIIRLNEQRPADRNEQPKRERRGRAPRGAAPQQGDAAEVTHLRPRPASSRRKNQSAA